VVHATTRTRPAGRRLIEDKLRRRGVDASVIASMTTGRDIANDAQAALDLARRRWVSMRRLEPAVAARRIAGLLLRRGFEEDIVANAIAALDLPDSAHE
jgi:regulatory protein